MATRTMCRVLGVSASGFYDWFERPQSKRGQANAQLLVRIRDSFAASDRTYGSPRILHDLQAAGETCSINRVARLMQAAGIKARHKRRRVPGQLVSSVHSVAPNLLDRQFQASGPNQKWAADFTYGTPSQLSLPAWGRRCLSMSGMQRSMKLQ
jgi:putative transposase